MRIALIPSIGLMALLLLAILWANGSNPLEAQDGSLYNCPEAGRWAISAWDGEDGTNADQAVATCGNDAVSAAYYLDPQTGGWLRWFPARPEISNLATLNNLQGIIALGSPSASPAATTAVPAGEGSVQSCPLAGRWAISVWSGGDGVGADQALATCGAAAVSAAYYLDPTTGGWLRWFPERPEISNLTALSNLQGVIALGSAGFSLSVDKFGEGTITSSPGGIDCGADCTDQAATFSSGSVVLTPTADPGSTFSHWTGCDSVSSESCTVQIDRDKAVFATFTFSEVKIPETTKVLDAATMGYLIRQEGSTYYFSPQAQAVAALQPGDVIVSGVGEGFIRKVTTVSVTAQEIAVATTDATLEDAIEQGTIILQKHLTPADVQSAGVIPPADSASADVTAASLTDFNVDIDAELMPGVKAYGTASLSADLEMAVSFDGWDWGCMCFPVKEARAVLISENHNELGLLAEAQFSFSKEKEIAKYTFAPIWVTIGPVPVGFFPELSLTVGVEGHAGAKMESKVTLDNTYAVGVRYRRGSGWSPVNDYSRDFAYTPPTLSAEAEAKAYIAPEMSVKVYGLVGPYFGLEGYLRLNAQPLETPWWSLYGGIGASAGFEAEALGVGLGNYSWPVWSKEWLLAQAGGGPTATGGCPVDDPEFCEFASDAAAAARTADVDWFVEHTLLVDFPGPDECYYLGEPVPFCETGPCVDVGLLGSEGNCIAVSTFEAEMGRALSEGTYLFGVVYPEIGLFEGNWSPYDEGPALLFGGPDIGKMMVAQKLGEKWHLTTVISMYLWSLYLYLDASDIDYWPDVSGVDEKWLDANLYDFLLRLPEHTIEYRIESGGFTSDDDPIVEITLYAIFNKPSQWCSYVQQLKEYGQHALEWIRSQGVDPEKLVILWQPEDWEAPSGPPCP